MGNVRVDTGAEPLEFAVNGAMPDFEIRTEKIRDWRVGRIDDRHLDLLDIVGAVFAADGMLRRGAKQRPRLGADWRRQLNFEIEVRQPGFWRKKAICDALAETVAFLTEDAVSFRFSQGQTSAPAQRYFEYDKAGSAQLAADHVVLFSGGLDSLAGALETLANETGRVVLVTHRSASKIITRQDALVDALRERHPGRVAYVPIRATRKGGRSPETTQRSRSLLFAAFGFVIARACGAKALSFFENGVVSQNLPLSPQVIGSMATRTTHPQTLSHFQTLLSLIDETEFAVRNPFAWQTKTEVVQKLRGHGAADLISTTVSCNHVWGRTRAEPHCGSCSQCLDRRFAILAADLADHEADITYATPVLLGARAETRSKVMAQEWTRHALRLADMSLVDFQQRFGGELARIARGCVGLGRSEVVRRSHELHQRHGRAVRDAFAAALSANASALMAQTLPDTALLRLITADATSPAGLAEVDAGVLAREVDADADSDADVPAADRLVVQLQKHDGVGHLVVEVLGAVTGAPAMPAFALFHHWRNDRASGREPDDYRMHPAKTLVPGGGASVSAVSQNIKRCRDQLAEYYEAIYGEPPPTALLVHGGGQRRGYRLDPWAVISGPESA